MQYSYDIMIVGAGMAGLSLACALAQRTTLSIAVLDKRATESDWQATHYGYRVSAFSLASQQFFQQVGIWDKLQQKRVSPFMQMQVMDASQQGKIHFSAHELKTAALGYIIENNLVQMELLNQLQQYPQVKFIAPVELISLQQAENEVIFTSAQQDTYQAKLVVAADGAHSWVREQLQIQVDKIDYHQLAIVGTVRSTLPHEQTARQIFLQTGPLASLPLMDAQLSSLVWSLPIELAQTYLALNEKEFNKKLRCASQSWLGDIIACEDRHVFPLAMQRAKQYVTGRVVLVADAAHTVHPLAGQGINMGLLDVMAMVEVVLQLQAARCELGDKKYWRRYERARKAGNAMMQWGVHGLQQLFSAELPLLNSAVAIGLNGIDKISWLKSKLAMQAGCGR